MEHRYIIVFVRQTDQLFDFLNSLESFIGAQTMVVNRTRHAIIY